jgi:AraC-like DNA-binding protein/quercetin dioxygenase-like cupin family protein
MRQLTQSALPGDFLSAQGTHRYYCNEIAETCRMVARLIQREEQVFAIEASYEDGFESSCHTHSRGQISYVRTGMMTVITHRSTLIVPAGHALWIPARLSHRAVASSRVSMMSAYTAEDSWADLPADPAVFQASDLFEPLIKRLIARQLGRDEGQIYHALLLLLHQEVLSSRRLASAAPMPVDARLRRVCERVLRELRFPRSKEEMARIGNMSVRTMTRLFQAELNMTYSEWVQQALILSAVGRLMRGHPVAHVAYDLGYASPSAFAAMFRRRLGRSPSDFTFARGLWCTDRHIDVDRRHQSH